MQNTAYAQPHAHSCSSHKNSAGNCASQKAPAIPANGSLMWWMCMLTAVLAIPALASLVVMVLQPSGIGAVAVFVLSCWACVYGGMKIVRNPKITFPYMLEHVQFNEAEKASCVQAITNLTADMQAWKHTYERCDTAFMNLAKQPAWNHMDELMAALGNIKQTVNTDGSVRFEDVKALNAWLVSSKPATIEAYMQALRGVYGYGHACAMEQGRDLNQLCPELEKGMMVQFEQAPARLKAYAWEFLGNLRKQYPFIAAQLNYAISESREPKLKLVAPSSTRAA